MRLKTDSLIIIGFTLIILSVITIFQTNTENITGYAEGVGGIATVCVGDTPVLTPIGNLRAPTSATFTYDVNHTGTSENGVTYTDNTTFFNIDETSGIISFEPQVAWIGNHTINISVFSVCPEFGGDTEDIGFEIFFNSPPVLDTIENQSVWEDGYCDVSYEEQYLGEGCGIDIEQCPVSITLSATDAEGDNVTYWCNDTTYFTINETTGIIEWTPTNDDVGLHWFNCTATDDWGAYDSQEFYINVSNTNDEPILYLISNFTVENNNNLYEDIGFEYDVNATDPDGDNITYSDDTPIFVISETTGIINFTATASQVGNHSVKIRADDYYDADPNNPMCEMLAEQLVIFEILPVNDVPQLDPMVSFSVNNESTLCVDANATDEEDGNDLVENPNLTFTDDTDLFDINSTGGFCLTPNASQIGSYTINISVTDTGIPDYGIGNATNSSIITLYVIEAPFNVYAPNISSYSPDLIYTKTGFEMPDCLTFELTAYDPEGRNTTTYWYLDGTLVNTTEQLPGLATHSYEKCDWTCPNTYNITAIVSDGELETSLEWTITITEHCVLPGIVFAGGEVAGGGRGKYYCKPTWVCTDWSTCMINDIQLRVCKDLRECGDIAEKPPEVRSCIFTLVPTCFDRIRNQDEILPDCGGVCKPCPTCSDGICDQGELCSVCDIYPNKCPRDLDGNVMVDCGGPCPLCPKLERVVQPKTTTWKTTVLTIIKISLIVLLIILILVIIILKVITYMSKRAVLTEKEKAEINLVNEINVLIKYAEKAIDIKDMEQLRIICANIEERYNRLSSTKNKKKVYPKLERLQKAIRIGF